MKANFQALVASALLAATVPTTTMASTLDAGFEGGNFNDGIMFDLFAKQAQVLTWFEINADLGTFDYTIYYRAGGINGHQEDPLAWTELGRFDAVTTAGVGRGTRLDFADLLLTGGLYGFYVTDSGAFSVNYSNAAPGSSGSVQVSNDALELRVGYGASALFADPSADRAFNGAIGTAVPEPSTWATMIAGLGIAGVTLRRRRTRLALA